jgi:DNA topoisomerase I
MRNELKSSCVFIVMPPKKVYKKSTYAKSAPLSTDIGTTSYLLIVESPSKCAKIEGYLGSQYKCIASKGHIRELVGMKSISVRSHYEPKFTIIKEKASHVTWMKKVIAQYPKKAVFVATDDDREGEGIAWHIMTMFDLPIATTKRIIFHEITQKAILDALTYHTLLDMNLVKAQHARQILDIIVGFKVSPHLWKHVRGGKDNALSAGRCQTPALRLVYDREKEIVESPLEMKYKVTAKFTPLRLDFRLNQETSNESDIKTFLETSKKYSHLLEIKDSRDSIRQPPKPFHTSGLLQAASNSLHLSPKITMQTAQILYQSGLITYMRTENTKYAPPFLETVRKYILEKYDIKFIGDIEKVTNTDKKNPHEAIRVTSISMENASSLGPREASLYKLIWRNTIESCMSPANYQVIPVEVSAPNLGKQSSKYTLNMELPRFLGWKVVKGEKESDEDKYLQLKTLYASGSVEVPFHTIESEVVARNKLTHYTESSLVQRLEDLGIGRPSTFAMLVETIQDRGYVKMGDILGKTVKCNDYMLSSSKILEIREIEKVLGAEKSKLSILPTGILCIEFLVKYFDELFNYKYTKNMECMLDEISSGKMKSTPWYDVCERCNDEIARLSKNVGQGSKEVYMIDDTHELIFSQYGPSIKKTSEDGSIAYMPVKSGCEPDLDKVRDGKYTLQDLLAFEKESLGRYKDIEIKIKKGKYGEYLEYGENKVSLKEYEGDVASIELNDAIQFIEQKNHQPGPTNIPLNDNMSIRSGKYGPYVYYKTKEMKKPKFLSLRGYDYKEKGPDEIMTWLKDTHGAF